MITYNSVKGGSIIPKILNNNYSSLWALNVTFLFHNQLNYRALIRNYKIFSSQCWLHHLHQSMLTYWSSKFSVAHLSFFIRRLKKSLPGSMAMKTPLPAHSKRSITDLGINWVIPNNAKTNYHISAAKEQWSSKV